MPAKRLSMQQVAAWRLTRQNLLRRTGKEGWLDTVHRIGGIPSRMMQAVELAVWARADGVKPADIRQALREDRTLVECWAMRGERYVLTSVELPRVLSALREYTADSSRKSQRVNGRLVSQRQADDLLEGIGAVLGQEPKTLESLAAAVAASKGQEELRALLLEGSADLLRPAAREGLLAFGPKEGEQDTFVRPDQWIKRWSAPSESPEAIMREAVKRYLSVYGPATFEEFARWWNIDTSAAKRLMRSLEGDIAAVIVDGREGWLLRSDVEELHAASMPEGTVRLLPHFDPYTVSMAHASSSFMKEPYRPLLYRGDGVVAPAVLLDGRVEGIWTLEAKKNQTELQVNWFEPSKVRSQTRAKVEEEAARLLDFYESDLILRC